MRGKIALTYRRRESNTGYKVRQHSRLLRVLGNDYETRRHARRRQLHAAEAILRLVRIMQADP